METENLERELRNFTGLELNEIAWNKQYPINPSVGIWGFLEAFREAGLEVEVDDKNKKANFILNDYIFGQGTNFPSTTMAYEEILSGWKHSPKSSPRAYYDSIHEVFNKMNPFGKDDFKRNFKEMDRWHEYSVDETRRARDRMEEVWKPYFLSHHEHMLVPFKGEAPYLGEPEIFNEIIHGFPLEILRNAIKETDFPTPSESMFRCGPEAGHLLDLDFQNDFEKGEYYPSEQVMTQYFLGQYLQKLASRKNYVVEGNDLRSYLQKGERNLEMGHVLNWDEEKIKV